MEKINEPQKIVEPNVVVISEKIVKSETTNMNPGITSSKLDDIYTTVKKRTVWFDWG